jgi:signal transduction histidine kinase
MSSRLLAFPVGVVAALPLLLLAAIVLWRDVGQKQDQIAKDREAHAQVAALSTNAFISNNLSTVRSLAVSIPLLQLGDEGNAARLFDRLVLENPDWQGASIIGSDGWNLVSSSSTPPRSIYVGDRPYFQQTLATGQPTVSSAIIGRASGVPTVVLTSPLQLSNGERGVLVATVPTSRLATTLRGQVETGTIRVVMVDANGQTIVDPDPARIRQLISLTADPSMAEALAGRSGSQIRSWGEVESLVAYAPVDDYNWGVLVVEPTDTAFASVRQYALQWLALTCLSVALVLGIGGFFSRRLAASFRREVRARTQAEDARAESEAARQRAAFLAEAGERLAAAVEYEPTLRELAQLPVPSLADWCVVDILDEQGRIRRLPPAHEARVDPERVAEIVRQATSPFLASHAVWEALDSRQPRLYEENLGALLLPGVSPELQRMQADALGLQSAIVVPLVARDHTLGALTLLSAESGRSFGADDLTFATLLAGRAGLALDNARLYEALQAALRTRDEFLSAASHDLRNPLAAIRGTAQLLQRQLAVQHTLPPERITSGLANIEAASGRLASLIDSLRDLAHLQMGQSLELERRPMDLVALVARVVTQSQAATDRHELQLDAVPTLVGEWDAVRLERIVGNLIDNAVKYSPEGKQIIVTVQRDDTGEGPQAVLTVADQGIGIPEQDLPRIFERFRRGSNVVGKFDGTGIGLAGARQIVEQHRGTITVESEVGRGSLVTVCLPLTSAAVPTTMPD